MRQVIQGKIYDTETARHLFGWDNGANYGDFKHRSKDLYVTKKGTYFLYHIGGAMTDMSKSYGDNSWGGSSAIEIISVEDAKAFLESHGGSDVLIEEFGAEEG